MSSKAEYLKRYLSAGPDAGDKKPATKPKKRRKGAIKIVQTNEDVEVDLHRLQRIRREEQITEQLALKQAEEDRRRSIEEKRVQMRKQDGSGWTQIAVPLKPPALKYGLNTREELEGRLQQDVAQPSPSSRPDLSPERRSPSPPPSAANRSSRSPASRSRSPRRSSPRGRHDSPDLSPKRIRHDSPSPSPARRRHDSPSVSPARRRHDSPDLSPPRRRHDSPSPLDRPDLSPARRPHSSDLSPAARGRTVSSSPDLSPPRKAPSDDLSPPRRRRPDPPGETARGHPVQGLPPPAERDSSPPRRANVSQPSGTTVVRDKHGRVVDVEKAVAEQRRLKEESEAKKAMFWSSGIVQEQEKAARQQKIDEVAAAPFARVSDDAAMNADLKRQARFGDPMQFMLDQQQRDEAAKEREQHERKQAKKLEKKKKKLQKKLKKLGLDIDEELVEQTLKQEEELVSWTHRPLYDGPLWPNRYGIRPGYRWDGVDRTNKWEAERFKIEARREATKLTAYHYSVEDM